VIAVVGGFVVLGAVVAATFAFSTTAATVIAVSNVTTSGLMAQFPNSQVWSAAQANPSSPVALGVQSVLDASLSGLNTLQASGVNIQSLLPQVMQCIETLQVSPSMMNSVVSQVNGNAAAWVQHYLPQYVAHQTAAMSGSVGAVGGAALAAGVYLCSTHTKEKGGENTVVPRSIKDVIHADFDKFNEEVNAKSVPVSEVSDFVKDKSIGSTSLLDRVAIRVYTGDWIFSDLNNTLRKCNCKIDDLPQWRTVTHALYNAIKRFPMPFENRMLYRGQVSLFGVAHNVGDVVTWPAFSSVTTNRDVAIKFAKSEGVVFEVSGITADCSASISSISVYPNEEEVLLMAGCRFHVDKIISGVPTIIHLTMLIENVNDADFCTVCAASSSIAVKRKFLLPPI
jgi:hypothetical protein